MRTTSILTCATILMCYQASLINTQNFYLDTSDSLVVDIDNFLPKTSSLNDLHVDSSQDLMVNVANKYEEHAKEFVLRAEIQQKMIASANFVGNIVFLYSDANNKAKVHLVKFDLLTKALTGSDLDLYDYERCTTIKIDHEYIFVGCLDLSEQKMVFCTLNYALGTAASCEPIDLDSSMPLDKERLELTFFTEPVTLMGFYFPHSTSPELKNLILLVTSTQKGRIVLKDAEGTIEKVSIARYNIDTGEVILLVFMVNDGKKTLMHYVIENFFVDDNGAEFRIIEKGIDDYIFGDDILFLITNKKDYIEVQDKNLIDWSNGTFKFENQKEITSLNIINDFFIMETVSNKGTAQISIVDNLNRRLFNLERQVKLRVSIATEARTFIIEFGETDTRLIEIMRFRYIKVSASEKNKNKRSKIVFMLNMNPIYTLNINFKSFEYVRENFKQPKVLNVCPDSKSNQIYLDIAGNNLKFGNTSPISYFNELSYNKEMEASIECDAIGSIVKSNLLLKLCEGYKLVILNDMKMDQNDFRYLNSQIFEIGALPSELKIIKLLYSKFVILIAEDKNIYYINIKTDSGQMVIKSNDILKDYDDCLIDNHYFICAREGRYYLIKAHYDGDDLFFKVDRALSIRLAIYKTLTLSRFDHNKVYYLRRSTLNKDLFYIEINIHGKVVKYTLQSEHITEKVLVSELYSNELLFLNPDTHKIMVWINNSLVNYPAMKNATVVLDFKTHPDSLIFAVLYKDIHNIARLYVGRSSMHSFNRQVADVEIGPITNVLGLDLSSMPSDKIMVSITSRGSDQFSRFFTLNLYGPLYLFDHTNLKQLSYELNGTHTSVPITVVSAKKELEIKRRNFTVEYTGVDEIIMNVEDMKKLEISGDLMDIKLESNPSNTKFFKRAQFIKKYTLGQYATGIKYDSRQGSLFSGKDSFSLFYADFLYMDNQVQHNSDFFNCKYVPTQYSDPNFAMVFVCIEKINGKRVLTNFNMIRIELESDNTDATSPQLIQHEDNLYFTMLNSGSQSISMWKMRFDRSTMEHELLFQKQLYCNEFQLQDSMIKAYYIHKRSGSDNIWMIMVPVFSTSIYFKEFDTENSSYLGSDNEEVVLKDDRERAIDDIACNIEENHLECIAKSDNVLYDLKVYQDGVWKVDKINSYVLYERLTVVDKMTINFSKKYIAVLMPSKPHYNIIVYERKDSQQENVVFTSIENPVDSVVSSIHVKDTAEGSKLYISAMEHNVGGNLYEKLVVNEYELNKMSVKIDMRGIPYKQELKFLAIGRDDQKVTVTLTITYNKYLTVYILIGTLVLMLLVFIALSIVACVMHKKRSRKTMQERDNALVDAPMYTGPSNLHF